MKRALASTSGVRRNNRAGEQLRAIKTANTMTDIRSLTSPTDARKPRRNRETEEERRSKKQKMEPVTFS
ncbi:hypothetical protein WAI453_007101 [Rhynchosporium graminicola]